jgi:hypothetical protein
MSLIVRRGGVGRALDELGAAASGLAGYTSASSSSSDGTAANGSGTASLTLRVPSAAFGKLQAAVATVGQVEASTSSSQDVTGQYVDLQARRNALTATRSTYLTMLTTSSTIGDTLAVQQRIDDLQVQIEQLEGQRQVLADSSDLATLTIAVREQGAAAAGPATARHGFSGAWHRSWTRFTHGLATLIAGLGPLVLGLLVLAIVWAAGWGALTLARRRQAP